MKRKRTKKLVVFICTGNTCRSPMAEFLFRKKTLDMGLKKLVICSAGTRANDGEPMNEKSAEILLAKGFESLSFKSKSVDKKMLKDSLAIVCMTDAQRDLLMEMRWKTLRENGEEEEEIDNNVYSFSELAGYEVMDPYGRDKDCYEYVFQLIEGGMSALTEKILPESIRGKYVEKPKKKTNKSGENRKKEKKI